MEYKDLEVSEPLEPEEQKKVIGGGCGGGKKGGKVGPKGNRIYGPEDIAEPRGGGFFDPFARLVDRSNDKKIPPGGFKEPKKKKGKKGFDSFNQNVGGDD